MAGDFVFPERQPEPGVASPFAAPSWSDNTSFKSDFELWQSGGYFELSARWTYEMTLAEMAGDVRRLADAANNLACAHRAAGDLVTAKYFQLLAATKECEIADGQTDPVSATSMGNLACDTIAAGCWAVAENLLWKALLADLATGDDLGTAADWANLGLLAGLLGDFDAARTRLWQALKLHRRQSDAFYLALDLWHLAQIFEADRDWTRSRKLYDRAATWFAKAAHTVFHQAALHQRALNAAREAVLLFDQSVN